MNISRELIELAIAALLVLFTSFHFVKCLNNRNKITLIDISVWITGISFGLSPFIVLLLGGYLPEAEIIDVVYSYIGLFYFIFGLLLIKKYFVKQLIESYSLKQLLVKVNSINSKQVFLLYSLFFIVRIIFAFDYGIFASGSETVERLSNLPYFLFVLRSLLDIIFFGVLLWSLTKILFAKKLILFPSIIIVIESLLFFFRGRRQMLYLVFLFLYIYIVLGYRLNYKILISSVVILLFLVNVVFPVFISLRQTSLLFTSSGDIVTDYQTSYYLLSKTGIDEQFYESNVAERSYINNWNINILSKSSLLDGLNGQALAMSALWVVPRPLLPYKGTLKDPELLISYTYGLSLKDSPSNWPAYGFADFGLMGSFIYGIFLGFILFFFQKLAVKKFSKYPFFSFVIIGAVSFLAFFIEEKPVAVFSVMRDALILFLIFYLFGLLKNKQSKKTAIPLGI